jgi:hypothetical protein
VVHVRAIREKQIDLGSNVVTRLARRRAEGLSSFQRRKEGYNSRNVSGIMLAETGNVKFKLFIMCISELRNCWRNSAASQWKSGFLVLCSFLACTFHSMTQHNRLGNIFHRLSHLLALALELLICLLLGDP